MATPLAVPTASQIRAQVASVRRKAPGAQAIGISVPLGATIGAELEVDGERLRVVQPASVLAAREALIEASSQPVVLLTHLDERELGTDVLARLAQQHLFPIDPWQLVKHLFQARYIDPRLVERHRWVADQLLEREPKDGYPPAPSGFLEAEMVWRTLFQSLLGLPEGRRDPEALLTWLAQPGSKNRLLQLSETERAGLGDAVLASAGGLAQRIFECAAVSNAPNPVAVGLVLRVLYDTTGPRDMKASNAGVRLEPIMGGSPLDPAQSVAWAEVAERVVERQFARGEATSMRTVLDEADRLLERIQSPEAAHRSRVLRSGFEQRLRHFGEMLRETLAALPSAGPEADTKVLLSAAASARDHLLTSYEEASRDRANRVQMALRLATWLRTLRKKPHDIVSLADAARAYRSEGGFVDWARAQVWQGDPEPVLRSAYGELSDAVRNERERENERFGLLFAKWNAIGSHDQSVVPVETVLARFVAPLGALAPVALIVLDGMSMAVFREIQRSLPSRGWIELALEGAAELPPVIAAVPSVTQASRTSLLSGAIQAGLGKNEGAAFVGHPALVSAGPSVKAPVLFHKGDLTAVGSVGLSAEVRDALEDSSRRVVGIVINAIDDHLARGDQVRLSWEVRHIGPLGDVLAAAQSANRVVILVSDHGHIVEHETEYAMKGDGERWREVSDGAPPKPGEVEVRGPRVALGKDGKVILPWSERLRYAAKANGYHGGASPQEVVIPLAVFASGSTVPAGWEEVAPWSPAWWDPEALAAEPVDVTVAVAEAPHAPKRSGKPPAQVSIFESEEGTGGDWPTAGAPGHRETPPWIQKLLASPVYAAQAKQAARTRVGSDRVQAVLVALEHSRKLTKTAFAAKLSVPALRVPGIVSALQRILNLDGYPVLSYDEASDTVELNTELLIRQFDLDSE